MLGGDVDRAGFVMAGVKPCPCEEVSISIHASGVTALFGVLRAYILHKYDIYITEFTSQSTFWHMPEVNSVERGRLSSGTHFDRS